uniref:proline-rich transmembrane protein 4 isoform X1 n=1 Tax=Solea senegalensis TaxID=28829 RepID=UPI001CD882E2|nr:proline-rich transmembrane protein 4 isoform X1 [Solea senegalensis]
MLSLWNLYLLLPLSLHPSLRAIAITGENVKETQQPGRDIASQHIPQPTPRLHGSGSVPVSPLFEPTDADFLGQPLSWSSFSSQESDRQGVIGEYVDLQASTEMSLMDPNEKEFFIPSSSESATEDVPSQTTQEQTFKYLPAETSSESNLDIQTQENHLISTALQNKTYGSLPSDSSPLSVGPGHSSDQPTPPVVSGSWGRTIVGPSLAKTREGTVPVKESGGGLVDMTDHRVAVNMVTEKDTSRDSSLQKSSDKFLLDGNMDTSTAPCKTTNQSWTPTFADDFTTNESLHPSLAFIPALHVPLYSDWNSALATWGFAWEAHTYGLGSVFTVFGLISIICLLGLPLRCPAGSPYFTLLHLFLLAFTGIQAFCLLYDAYSHQDRLPPLGSLLLSVLPFPCLISAFSLAFLLLSLRSRMHLSFPLAISTHFSALPKPCLLLCVSLLHFGVSLGCVGLLQLFDFLPTMILLFPQGLFVCLTIFLSLSYLIFYCLIQIDTKHIYRLNDNGENGGSPEVIRPASCPFSKVEDWRRAAVAGVGASFCLLGCGGLQLYGILHALGLGGVDGYGFHPWPWWGYQVGCRLCEIGVCLGLSLIGTHPLCSRHSSIKTTTHPRPGSWSRLSCSSPSRGLTLPSPGSVNSPVLSTYDSWSQGKKEKQVVCNVITQRESDALPLCSIVDHPRNGCECLPKSSRTQTTVLPLPSPPSPPQNRTNAVELSSLGQYADSTVDLQPPSPIDLSRSIDQALFSESLFSHSIFGLPRLTHASSSHSLSSPSQGTSKNGQSSVDNALYRTSSCGDVGQEKNPPGSKCSQPHSSITSHSRTPEHWEWKGSVSGSTQGLCSNPKETGKLRSNSWANRGHNFTQHSLPRAIHLSYHRRYRTLSAASRDMRGSGRLAGTKHLSESKQLEWDLAVQAEFVNVCRQIDALSVCSDTIEL